MDKEFESSIKDIVWALRRISSLIYFNSRDMAKKYGVTGPQILVLKTLSSSENPLSSSNLSRHLNVTAANITGIIDRLEQKGLVQRIRKPDDRRTVLIEPTPEGKRQAEILPDLVEEKLMRGLKDLKPTEIFGIYSALEKMIQIIGKEAEEEPEEFGDLFFDS